MGIGACRITMFDGVQDRFSKIVELTPVRLPAVELTEVAAHLARRMASGGEVETAYEVDFEDGVAATYESDLEFIAALKAAGEKRFGVEVVLWAWDERHHDIPKSIRLSFRRYGSTAHVTSTDVMWGRGTSDWLKHEMGRFKPWYSPLRGVASGATASKQGLASVTPSPRSMGTPRTRARGSSS